MTDLPIDWEVARSDEIDARQPFAKEVFETIFDAASQPVFVSDETCVDDLSLEPEHDVERRILEVYGLRMTPRLWGMQVWKFLDHLKEYLAARNSESRPQ
jgi:hypothetical protein